MSDLAEKGQTSHGSSMPAGLGIQLITGARLLGVVTLLSVAVNLRYPGSEGEFWYLRPALDVILLGLAEAAWLNTGRRLPKMVHSIVASGIVLIRALRIADGVAEKYFNRPLDLYVDARLLPELLRTLATTAHFSGIVIGLIGMGGAAVLLWFTARWASMQLAECLQARTERRLFFAACFAFALSSPLRSTSTHEAHYAGAFGASVLPRLASEFRGFLRAPQHIRERSALTQRVQRQLARSPHDLALLGGSNVFLILVESYGKTLLRSPHYAPKMAELYARMDHTLSTDNWRVVSSVLDSPVYGGGSALARLSLATGVSVSEPLDADLLKQARPLSLGQFFREAGYATVLAQPGTTRAYADSDFAEFDQKYNAPNFNYHGPRFGWATMPDQFVLEVLQREVIAPAMRPLFLECALVSSHAPWNHQPKLLADNVPLGDGSVFNTAESVSFETSWTHLSAAQPAYLASIAYDLEVLTRYIVNRAPKNTLFIILGDHQPAAELTDGSPEHGVPVHVVSRNPRFLEAFERRGYSPGMKPQTAHALSSFEAFLPAFLQDFSSRGPALRDRQYK